MGECHMMVMKRIIDNSRVCLVGAITALHFPPQNKRTINVIIPRLSPQYLHNSNPPQSEKGVIFCLFGGSYAVELYNYYNCPRREKTTQQKITFV